MGAEELTGAPATALAALVADRAASAREVVEAHLRRIEEVDGAVNAVVQLDAEGAMARACEADEALETDNPVYGRTSNPYDLSRTPGGSSGGEAACIAAGCSPCGIGTDSGASVRLPAHFCGLAAIKPTAGRVPVTGIIDDEGQIGALGDARTQVGPLARSVADVALALGVIAGPDGRDGGFAPVPLRHPAAGG